MEYFKIEKNLPMPFGQGKDIHILRSMGVGDSMVVPTAKIQAIRAAASRYQISIKTLTIDSQSVRVWRKA